MRYPAARDGDEDAFPDVRAEEGGCDVGVLEGEEGGGEGFEGWTLLRLLLLLWRCGSEAEDWGGGRGEVDELRGIFVSCAVFDSWETAVYVLVGL